MTLHELAVKYGSDKAEHGYCDFYEQHLPKNPKKILEIGILKGASIRMWREYFPEAEIHGLDLFEENSIPDIDNVTFWKGSQTDYKLLEQLCKQDFDLIIDDCSHVSRHQLVSFFALYKKGCAYFIEDCHSNIEEFYRVGLPYELTVNSLPFFSMNVGGKIAMYK